MEVLLPSYLALSLQPGVLLTLYFLNGGVGGVRDRWNQFAFTSHSTQHTYCPEFSSERASVVWTHLVSCELLVGMQAL